MNIEYLLIQCFLQCVETWNLRKQQIYYRNRPAAQAASSKPNKHITQHQAPITKNNNSRLKTTNKQKKTKKEGGEKKKKKKRLENVKKCE
jgi:hypothetical protein